MKPFRLTALFGLSVFVACNPAGSSAARGSRSAQPTAMAAAAVCDTNDCIDVARAAVQWVLTAYSYSPSDLVLDTARTGMQRAPSGPAVRGIPLVMLQELITATGIGAGSSADLDCSARPVLGHNGQCRLRHGRALVVLQVPKFGVDAPGVATIVVQYGGTGKPGANQSWTGVTYTLTLAEEAERWRVTNANILDVS